MKKTVVFIHGWSVTNTNTYGGLPKRLAMEAQNRGLELDLQHIFLGRYISFHNEVTLSDISRAFQTALKQQLPDIDNFICITHSTGGPVVRDWWNTYYSDTSAPLTHLIMLAPANFGSALAQLGKEKLSRIKSFFDGVEPGQRVLDWLELGSKESWTLNQKWITEGESLLSKSGVYPFVLTGQSIDRKIYDHLNSYTGELGSDGVVRTAAANLNACYIRLVQPYLPDQQTVSSDLVYDIYKESPATPLRVISGKSHSGTSKGIMASVSEHLNDADGEETINSILACIEVKDYDSYNNLISQFNAETDKVQQEEREEKVTGLFLFEKTFIHDRYSQVIFRLNDSEGNPITDYDLIFTAGNDNNPNHLPDGFAADRQQNSKNKETITYYFNHDAMLKTDKLGLKINPRPSEGFVRYVPCEIIANNDLFNKVIHPNSTTLIDIVLHRAISTEVFRIEKTDDQTLNMDFSNVKWKQKPII